jgi:predicted nucleic acid-binding protein
MAPASNEASTRREKCPAKVNPDWLHSVIAKAVLLLPLTAVWKLSYATEDGLLPILCEKSGLTAYDVAYLELALRLELPLATCDSDLRKAASAEEIELPG